MTPEAPAQSTASDRHILLIFLDGIGLGDEDATTNPFASARMPTLTALTGGKRWLRGIGRQDAGRAAFAPADPRMGIPGRPQSASGQGAIVTGRNIPMLIGEHYGPRPNIAIRALLDQGSIFSGVIARGGTAALLEGYPPGWHEVIARGRRLPSSYQYAALKAGIRLFNEQDIRSGDALSGDWTGEGWRSELGYTDTPVYTPEEAGRRMVMLARRYNFAFFPHWWTDMVGHRGSVEDAVRLLELFDRVMAGALDAWNDADGLMVITSDHGNLEEMSHGKHTENDVPLLVIGQGAGEFIENVSTLADLAPRMLTTLFGPPAASGAGNPMAQPPLTRD